MKSTLIGVRARFALVPLVVGVFLAVVAAACSKAEGPTGAGLELVVTSDLALPADLDHVRVIVSQGTKTLLLEEADLGPGAVLLPATFFVAAPSDPSPVRAQAVGSKAGAIRVQREATTTIPASSVAALLLPLDYLCTGYGRSGAAGASPPACADGQTCVAGTCGSEVVPPDALLPYPIAEADGGAPACFPTLPCFAEATNLTVDPGTCTVAPPPTVVPGGIDRVSLALHLAPYGGGVCDAQACWVVLDQGAEGWRWVGTRIQLPLGVCTLGGAPPEVSLTTACRTKVSTTSLCGPWSSVTNPEPVPGAGPSGDAGSPLTSSGCVGADLEPCGNCGTASRTCVNGAWSPWSACENSGVCAPSDSQACGMGGYQVCTSTCTWGDCLDEGCSGASSRTCGNCGTQKRSCTDGAWSDYGPCTGEGACAPNATQACGAGGTQSCGGDCRWSVCGSQSCVGPSSQACGNCGTQTRTCADGVWSSYGPCTGEGECTLNTTASCGTGGTKACIGACHWDACSGQTCSGSPSQACGNCGTQTRSCNNGVWSAYGACTGQGECAPFAIASCGTGGTKVCLTGVCTFSPCGNQSCTGASSEGCGMCGTHSRTCNNGTWSNYGSCDGQGACTPNATQACGNGGTQTCGSSCTWGACQGQACSGATSQACGNCGTQTRTCSNGVLSDFGACSNQGACAPNTTQACGNGGSQTCGTDCQWGTCTGTSQTCSGPDSRSCGNCGTGTQTRKCNTSTGKYGGYGACQGGGACAAGDTQACNDNGSQTCQNDCTWGACSN